MQRCGIALALAVAAAGVAVAPLLHTEQALSAQAAKGPRPLLGIVGEWSNARLVRVDPRSLRPLRGPHVDVFDPVAAWAFSPDDSRLALATGCQAGFSLGALQLVDARRIRQVGCLAIDGVSAVAWPRRDRLLAVAYSPLEALLIDPGARRVIARTTLEGVGVTASGRAGDRLVVLTAALRGRQLVVPRLVVADVRGRVRSVRVEVPPESDLVVEPSGRHAYLVSGGTFAKVDLGTLGVVYVHRAPGRPRQGSTVRGSALWLGRGLIASFGSDFVAGRATNEPVGLRLIDTRRRTVRLVDENVSVASLIGDVLLATGAPRIGLVAYDLRGRKRFQLFRGRSVGLAQSYGGKAYISVAGRAALQVVDAASGRVLAARRSPLPLLLLRR